MTEGKTRPSIVIRDLETVEEISKVEEVEKRVWELEDRDVSPSTLLIAAKAAGSILVGAFDGKTLVGFGFALPALEDGHVSFHSHMLAVLPEYRDLNLGYKLKLAQRERALAKGVRQMTWTFDPLQSRNAHFNFAKVGAISDRYKVDFYGNDSSSSLHQNGTDRLWLTWPIASRRVQQRLQSKVKLDPLPVIRPLVRFNGNGRPACSDLSESLIRQRICIEIPGDIVSLEKQDSALAREWRMATRWAFDESLKAGFFVAEYYRSIRGQQGPGAYLLQLGSVAEFIADM